MGVALPNNATVDLTAVAPVSTRIFANTLKGDIEKFLFWIGRFIVMISLKYTTRFGDAQKVADTFQDIFADALMTNEKLRARGKQVEAEHVLFQTCFDLTFLNSSEIATLNGRLPLRATLQENILALAMLERAERIAQVVPVSAAIKGVKNAFRDRIQQQLNREIVVAPAKRPPAQQPPMGPRGNQMTLRSGRVLQ